MTAKAKAHVLIFLWCGIGVSVLFATPAIVVRGVLLLVALCVTVHVLNINTLDDGEVQPKPTSEQGS